MKPISISGLQIVRTGDRYVVSVEAEFEVYAGSEGEAIEDALTALDDDATVIIGTVTDVRKEAA